MYKGWVVLQHNKQDTLLTSAVSKDNFPVYLFSFVIRSTFTMGTLSLGGFSVIPSTHGICSIPTTRYWCCQNTEIPWLLGIAKIPRTRGGKYRPLGIPKIPRLRWIPPNHKNRGCLLFGPHYREQHIVTQYLWVCQSIIRALEVLPCWPSGRMRFSLRGLLV